MEASLKAYLISAIAAFTLSAPIRAAPTQQDIESLRTEAGQYAARFRKQHAFEPGGCDVNVLLGGVITRSREPSLHAGDRIVSVQGHLVSPSDDVFELVNALPPDGTVTLGIIRNRSTTKLKLQCLNSRQSLAIYINAADAASAGRFADCVDDLGQYEKVFVQSSSVYRFRVRCAWVGGQLSDDTLYEKTTTYWTLRLQELKFRPEQIEEVRPGFLEAQAMFAAAGKTVLAQELRRQWMLATGETTPTNPTSAASQLSQADLLSALQVMHRQASRGCSDGHWIDEVLGDGAIIKLEDGTLWHIDEADRVVSGVWVPTTDIVECDGKLINTEDNESVDATPISH